MMTPPILDSIKRTLVVGVASGLCSTAVVMLWLQFPSLVPLAVLIVVGVVGGVTFLVCGTVAVLRVAKMFVPPGPLAGEIRNLPPRTLAALATTLVLCNGALIYFTDLRPIWVYVLAVSGAIVVSWAVARLAAARHIKRR